MPEFMFQFWLFSLGATVTAACHTQFAINGNYSISPIDSNYWLNSGPFSFVLNGTRRSTDDGSLSVSNHTATSGVDDIGQFTEDRWYLSAGNITMEAAMRNYPDISLPIVVFIQRFPTGVSGARSNLSVTITSFPSFQLQDSSQPLGYLSYGSFMFGDLNKQAGIWGSSAKINDGLDGSGPLALFDELGNALVISPLDNFMAASIWQETSKGVLNYGIMGGVDSLPANFEYRTIAFCSTTGVGDAFDGWGRLMRRVYNKTEEVREYHQLQDLSLTHLGYWTDNGAYYYYNTEQGKNYQDTLLDAKTDWTSRKIPYKYLQIDSWFYHKDSTGAVTTWDATEDIFPQGIRMFGQKIDLPLVAHNRYWSINTTYAKLRGGFFDFVTGNSVSLPNEQFFWEFLIGHGAVEWGLIVYEQDWLNVQFLQSEFLTSDLYLARTWLTQMGTAAAKHNVKIQYCMALSRHAYQSLEIPTVTQARVSNDYHSEPNQWKIGVSSHFAHAMGVAPSKDTFWTTSHQPGNTYGKSEPYPTLQVVVATLSGGSVGPGDMIGGTNASVLLRCCDESGLILKPSKPARAIDDQIKEMAFGNNTGVSGEVWSTYSINGDLLYGVIFAAGLTRDYVITPQSAGFLSQFAHNFTDSVIYSSGNKTLYNFTAETNFTISANHCSTNGEPFCLFYTAPVLMFGSRQVSLLGDMNKWVPMSERRVAHIWQTSSGIAITLSGAPQEDISFTYAIDGVFFENSQAADQVGCATFSVVSSDSSRSVQANVTTATTATTWKPTLPPGYDCRFKPPPLTTPPATA